MGLGIYLAGEYPTTTFGSSRKFLTAVRDWLSSNYAAMVLNTGTGREEPGTELLYVSLHPCAEDVEITATAEGIVTVGGKTTVTGAGYHIFLCQLLHRLRARFGIEWDQEDEYTGDETGSIPLVR